MEKRDCFLQKGGGGGVAASESGGRGGFTVGYRHSSSGALEDSGLIWMNLTAK